MTSSVPFELLEQRAAEQRRQIHNSVNDLRGALREKLDVKHNAREHLLPASGIAAFLGVAIGYGIAGLFFD